MTQEFLQDAMVADLKALFAHERLKNSLGVEREIQIYPQDVPIRESDDEAMDREAPPEPYVVVRLRGGKTESDDDPQIIDAVLVTCVYDPDPGRQGYRDALHIINKIYHHYSACARDRQPMGSPLPYGVDHPGGGHTPVLFHGHVPADPGAGGPQGGARSMTAKKQTKPAAEAGTLVYCGPTIPGVAKQFTPTGEAYRRPWRRRKRKPRCWAA